MPILSKTKSLLSSVHFNLKVQSLPDRVYLREVMLPSMAKTKPENVLLAGTRRYTRRYPSFFAANDTVVWTLDFDPSAARFGNGPFHRTGDHCEVDQIFESVRFDVIHLNGILGFGIDTPDQVERMTEACHRALNTNGHIMIGWDSDRTTDPAENPTIISRFEHSKFADLPARHAVTGLGGYDHVFDWFRRTD
ncbi:MAG: class I SAM-dependent methyltransferase [Rhodopirellula sp. JB044]|uniref:class I SAM-dependent methyltransferase n=1 Tax=Rhodopirellula sp. JB044 TaxID=3342844 RepID=UPI00370CE7FE